jgi:hypothetical protein
VVAGLPERYWQAALAADALATAATAAMPAELRAALEPDLAVEMAAAR